MFKKLRDFLHGDAGENSLMVILSQFVSLIVAAALAGLVFVLITGGTKIQAENNAQSELRIANRAFVNDVDNAARIYVESSTKLTLSSTKFLKNASGNYVCRASSWYTAPASDEIRKSLNNDTLLSLMNDVTIYTSADCSSAVVSTQQRVAVSAVTEDSFFKFKNVAGVQIEYNNGIVTTFNSVTPALVNTDGTYNQTSLDAFRTAKGVKTWFTDEEMLREVPKVIEASLIAYMPVSEETNATFKATTNEAETELIGNNDNITDPGGEQTRWVPNPVADVFVKRSTTTGPFVGGVREGIQITWSARPATECSPLQTLTYSWLVTNIRTNAKSSGETNGTTVHVMTGTGGPAQIWNGGNYKVQVAARCNDIDGQSADRAINYTLPLPAVINVGVTANAPQTTHTVTYSSASSDPTTTYAIDYSAATRSIAANTYVKNTTALVTEESGASNGTYPMDAWLYPSIAFTNNGTTANTSYSKTGNTVVAGYPDTYRIHASTADSPNTSFVPSYANYTYNVATPTAPTITVLDEDNFDWSAPTCTTGTTQEYRGAYTNAIGTLGNPPVDGTAALLAGATVQTTRTITYPAINQGSRIYTRVEAHCVTRFTLDPTNGQVTTTLSPWSADGTDTWDRPIAIPAAPTSPRQNYVGYGLGSDAQIAWNASSCATGTVLAYYQEYTAGSGGNSGYTTALVRTVTHGEVSGTLYNWRVKARCESFATGVQMKAESAWSASSYYTSVRLLGISVYRSDTNVVVGTSVYIGGSISCDSGVSGVWTDGPAYVSRSSPGTYYFTNSGYCAGANGQTSGVGSSGSVSVYWYQRDGYPGGNDIVGVGTNGCPLPGGYTPQQGVAFRINASQGGCYWQSAQPVRDGFGNPTGSFQPWTPGYPGNYYASYSG